MGGVLSPCSSTTFGASRFQSFSLYTVGAAGGLMTAAQDDVTTILLTPDLIMALMKLKNRNVILICVPVFECAGKHSNRALYGGLDEFYTNRSS
jgi:hypothetical protein